MNNSINTLQMTDEEIRNAFVKCFLSREGKIVLSYLERMTLERYLGPDSTSEQLRHLEGQRHLVCYIKSLTEEPTPTVVH